MRKVILIAFALTGFSALTYEVIWTRLLSLILGSTIYAVSIMLTVFMLGLALGGYVGGRLSDKVRNLLLLLGVMESLIGGFGLLFPAFIEFIPPLYFSLHKALYLSFWMYSGAVFLLTTGIMGIPTTLMGITFPLVAKLCTTDHRRLGTSIGEVYFFNNLGAIFGAFLGGFVLIDLAGILGTIVLAASVNFLVGFTLVSLSQKSILKKLTPIPALVFVIPLLYVYPNLLANPVPFYPNLYLANRFPSYATYLNVRNRLTTIFYEENREGTVSVFQLPGGAKFMYHGGKIEGGVGVSDVATEQLLGLIPLAVRPQAKRILVIGLGPGVTFQSVLSASMKDSRVDVVEINPGVVRAAKEAFVPQALADPRTKMHINDARNFLLTTEQNFDLITSEPSYPAETSSSSLFTDEFFAMAKKHLAPKGVFVQWLPYYWLPTKDVNMLIKTFARHFAFAQAYRRGNDVLMAGSDTPLPADQKIASWIRARNPKVTFKLWKREGEIQRIVKDSSVPLNTDDKPLLELNVPKYILLGPAEIKKLQVD